jgi:demethylmenaquinone methyltransferase/2-methoxy-6-polyprenyl-1,4-benzoquinol methylase
LPRLGSLLSGDRHGAYSYLPETVLAFPEREAFLELMRGAGLERASYEALTFGVAAIYRAEVPRG